jgi:hypothetical protein
VLAFSKKAPFLVRSGSSAFELKAQTGGKVTVLVTNIELTRPILSREQQGDRTSSIQVTLRAIWVDQKGVARSEEYSFGSDELVWTATTILANGERVDPEEKKSRSSANKPDK